MPDDRFENYQVLKRADGSLWELGRGAMGVTYKAFDTDLHCEVALKVIQPQILDTEDARGRFLREARSAARLRHPNIAAIFRLGRAAGDTYFYAMEFCEGETLQRIVDERGPLDAVSALAVVLQITRALVLANEHQLVHRDIKPANLILNESSVEGTTVKIIDFGLAKSCAAEGNSWASMGTSGFVGTAHFASPEQLENGHMDGRSDIYSLGATLWFMITGRPLFSGSIARVMSQHLSAPVPWPAVEAFNVPLPVRALITRMLEKDPADRPQSALELRRDVEECLSALAGQPEAPVRFAGPAPPAPPASPPTTAGVVLAGRWQLLEERVGSQGGRLFRAVDLQQRGKPVAVKVLAAGVAADPETCRLIEDAVKILGSVPQENLIQPLAFAPDGAGSRFLALEWMEGFTLLAVLRARGALALRETLVLLEGLAAGFDHARRHGLTRLELARHQILVHFPAGFENEQEREQTLRLPLAEWPPFKVALDVAPLESPSGRADTLLAMQTLLPSSARATTSGTTAGVALPAPDISGLGRLVYELLGGTPAATRHGPLPASARYVPLSRLSEAGNTVLRRALMPTAGDPGFLTAREFYDALAGTADFEPARPGTVRARPAPVFTEGGPAASPRRGAVFAAIGLTAVLVGVALAGYLGRDRFFAHGDPVPPAVLPSATPSAATPSLTGTPAQAVSPPPARLPAPGTPVPTLEPLAGNLEHVEHSSRGTMRVEFRRSSTGTSIWLIPEADESRRRLLYKYSRNAQVLFSPDEKWLLINDHPTSSGGGAQLYRRTRDDDIIYEVPVDMDCFTTRIEDLAWRFYIGETGLPADADRNHVSIDGVDWQPDSSAFTLRFVSFGSGGMDTVPATYFCRYELASQSFRAVTDAAQARNAIAARAQEKAAVPATTATAAPLSVAAPAATWQTALGNFVAAFVRCNQARDTNATLTYYAPTVDYFGEGRVNQAYMRNDIGKYNVRWPVRHDNIIGNPELREIIPGQSYAAAFHLAFYVESAARKEWIRGEFALEMTVTLLDGTPRITFIREKVVRRDKGVLTEGIIRAR